MGTVTIDLASGNKVRWPNKCAFCGSPATKWAEASLTAATSLKYYGVALGWKEQTHSISYPVCEKHRFFCNLLNLPSKWGFINSFLFLILVPTFVWIGIVLLLSVLLGIKGDDLSSIMAVIAIISYGSTVFYFVYSAFKKPIRISGISGTLISLKINNNNFLRDFINYNKGLFKM